MTVIVHAKMGRTKNNVLSFKAFVFDKMEFENLSNLNFGLRTFYVWKNE